MNSFKAAKLAESVQIGLFCRSLLLQPVGTRLTRIDPGDCTYIHDSLPEDLESCIIHYYQLGLEIAVIFK